MEKSAVFLFFLTLFFMQAVNAQNSDDNIEDFKLILKHTGDTYLKNPDKPIEDTDTIYTVCVFKIKDKSKLSKLYVKLGNEGSEGKKADLSIDLNNPDTGLPKNMKYYSKGNQVYLTLGEHAGMRTYLSSIVTEDKSGKKSTGLKAEKK